MMHAEVKQIMPAPGWRVWIAEPTDPPAAFEVPVIGWGVVKFTNDQADMEDLNLMTKSFTTADLVVYYNEDSFPIRLFHDLGTPVTVFAPDKVITQDDKAELEAEAADERERQVKNRAAIVEHHKQGLTPPQIATLLNIPRDVVLCTIAIASHRAKRRAA